MENGVHHPLHRSILVNPPKRKLRTSNLDCFERYIWLGIATREYQSHYIAGWHHQEQSHRGGSPLWTRIIYLVLPLPGALMKGSCETIE
jgi:hypothetical protein